GEQTFSLQNLFAEERHRIMRLLSQDTLQRLDQLYTQIYRENYGILMAFHRDRISVPQELQVAAEIALSHRALDIIRSLEADLGDVTENVLDISTSYIAELEGVALEASHFNCQLKLPGAKETLEQLIVQALRQTLQASDPKVVASAVTGINRLITLGEKLQLGLSLDRAQETYYHYLHTDFMTQEQPPEVAQNLLQIGQQLAVCSVPMSVPIRP
ncbi:MAG: glycoside hydrolase, partial [Cyanobacteria bacterium P01_G01_bin.38]